MDKELTSAANRGRPDCRGICYALLCWVNTVVFSLPSDTVYLARTLTIFNNGSICPRKELLCSVLLPSSFLLMNAFTSSSFSLTSVLPLASCHFLYSLVSFLPTLLFCCAFVCVYDCVCWFPCTKTFPAEVYKSLLWRSALTFFINLLLPATLHT